MRSNRALYLIILALVLGWVFLSQKNQPGGSQSRESSSITGGSNAEREPKGKYGLIPSEATSDPSSVENSELRVPTQEPRSESATRTPETPSDSVPIAKSADRRLQRIDKAISDYDGENFDERLLDDESLLDQFAQDGIPVSGPRGDASDSSADSSRVRDDADPYEGNEEDSSYPSAR